MEGNQISSKNLFDESAAFRCNIKGDSIKKTSAVAVTPLIPDKDNIHFKFSLDSDHNFRSVFKKQTIVKSIKQSLGNVLDVNEMEFKLNLRKKELDDTTLLDEFKESLKDPIEIGIDFLNSTLGIEKFNENLPSLDIITVHMQGRNDFTTDITIIKEDQSCQKEWLGGYRSKLNGKEYHNASVQTSAEHTQVKKAPKPTKFHRDTQTAVVKTKQTTTVTSQGTQMWRRDHYITSKTDKIIVAKPYKLVNKNLTLDTTANFIQKLWRDYMFRKRISSVISGKKQKNEEKQQFFEEVSLEHYISEGKILAGLTYPVKRQDFSLLYIILGLWIKKYWQIQHTQSTDLTRKAKKYILMGKGMKSLFNIEKHKINHKKESLKKEEIRFLQMGACPKTFKNRSGKLISVEDIETQRAREFKEIYSELIKNIEPTKRINSLITIKNLFKTKYFTYEYADDIVSLIDREISFITMGMRNKDLKGLRMRIEQLFLHFTHQEEFNPKAAKYKKPNYPLRITQHFTCVRCTRLLPPSKFPVHFRMKDYSVCTSCQWVYDIGHIHVSMTASRKLLEQIRQDEMDKCCLTSICFLLQPQGMAYLTVKIWHNHSAISESKVVTNLRHVRWLKDVEWSPWNTILLTTEEAQFHSSIPDVHEFYGQSFIMLVHKRHIEARNYFKDLEKVDYSLCSTGTWTSSKDYDIYLQKYYAEVLLAKDDDFNMI